MLTNIVHPLQKSSIYPEAITTGRLDQTPISLPYQTLTTPYPGTRKASLPLPPGALQYSMSFTAGGHTTYSWDVGLSLGDTILFDTGTTVRAIALLVPNSFVVLIFLECFLRSTFLTPCQLVLLYNLVIS